MSAVPDKRADTSRLAQMCDDAVKKSKADQTEVSAFGNESAVTRFAGSRLHQNNFESDIQIQVRVAVGKRVGQAATNKLDAAVIGQTVDDAIALARLQDEDPDFADFPDGPQKYTIAVPFVPETADFSPMDRAKACLEAFKVSDSKDYTAAGTLTNTLVRVVIVNSHGIKAECATTQAEFSCLFTGPNSSGFATDTVRDVRKLDFVGLAKRALDKAKLSANPSGEVPAGQHTVILEEEAVSDLVMFLNWLGFGGKTFNDGESYMCGKIGQQITGSNITIYDDAADPRTFGLPFDFEGVPKQKVTLIENGVAKGVVHDQKSAKKAGAKSTGHSLGGWAGATSVVLAPGAATYEEMLASVKHGILVSRFHYTNVVEPMSTTITGMTRDGTFLIEDGKIVKGLKNFRITQSVLEAFKNAQMMSKTQRFSSIFWGGGCLVPKMKIEGFNFSGKTEF